MDDLAVLPRPAAQGAVLHRFEFRGSGGEFFRIWIVNIALMLVTLGIYSAWAKVRTRRYFYGNTFVAGHSFDYHASPVRILIGRMIAVALLGISQLASLSPFIAVPIGVLFFFAVPWLIVSSRRFNARNTSYRNVRFNFLGTYGGAFITYIAWTIAAIVTLGGVWPLAHRARDYYYINNHSFGGKPFATQFSGWSIYKIYLVALGLLVLVTLTLAIGSVYGFLFTAGRSSAQASRALPIGMEALAVTAGWIAVASYVYTRVFNLAVSHTTLDGRHSLVAALSARKIVWIGVSNLILVLVTLGLFYPWARVRVSRYMADHLSLLAASDLDEFTSESFATQSAIGEEIAGFFDYDIGL